MKRRLPLGRGPNISRGTLVVCALVMASVLAACGQKPGVHVPGSEGDAGLAAPAGAPAAEQPLTGTADIGAGDPRSSGEGSAVGSGAGGSSSVGTADDGQAGGANGAAGSSAGTEAGGGSNGQGRTASPQGSDRTGVSDDTITLAMHAPVTGAAPLPVTTFEKSRDLYWRFLEGQGRAVLGRERVEVTFRDDKYDPSSAIQVCRELAQRAFLIFGAGGTDQIQACARFADQARVPYVSVGVTEAGVDELSHYFAISMTYKQQGPLLASFVTKNFGGKKVAAVVTNTPNFDDAVEGWEEGVRANGLDYYGTLRHPKGDSSWYNGYASELKQAGVEVLYINSSPVDYIRFAQQAAQQGFTPQYVGVGVTFGLNAVLGSGCDEVDGGIFFSPFPGLDWARKNLPEFFETGRRRSAPTDDVALGLWGAFELQHAMLERYGQTFGNDLTREDFRDNTERQQALQTKVYPSSSYSPQDHFGSRQVHVLQADCSTGEHRTLAAFVAEF